MSILKPTTPLYNGMSRLFVLIAVVWAGVILFRSRQEHFDVVRPDVTSVRRVDDWLSQIDNLPASNASQTANLPDDRRALIQKAIDTGTYNVNGLPKKLLPAELKGASNLLQNVLSASSKRAIDKAPEWVAYARKTTHIGKYDGNIDHTPVWDFRGVDGFDLAEIEWAVRGIIDEIHPIKVSAGMESRFPFGMVETFKSSGEYTGLLTESDLSLADDLRTARQHRWYLKPLFWFAAWLVPLLALGLVTIVGIALARWVIYGFRPKPAAAPKT